MDATGYRRIRIPQPPRDLAAMDRAMAAKAAFGRRMKGGLCKEDDVQPVVYCSELRETPEQKASNCLRIKISKIVSFCASCITSAIAAGSYDSYLQKEPNGKPGGKRAGEIVLISLNYSYL